VEERILELQARKKHLASELISEEGFVKTLGEEDIAFLFK
jgi:SNF2 family DNA or RNA helicase